jgi:3-oxoadipate enol-lactonase
MPGPASPLPPGGYVELPGRGTTWVWDTGGDDLPAVVLLHGWTSTAALNWCRCFAPLSPSFRVLALDQRGHGRGIRSLRPFRLEDCADDVAALIDAKVGAPAAVVGYSMGGPVAQLVWRRHPDAVRGLVLCATAATFPGPPLPEAAIAAVGLGLSLALSAIPPQVRQEGFRRLVRSHPAQETLAAWARRESEAGEPVAFVQAGVALNSFDSNRWIGDVDVPTAVVVTTEDTTVPTTRQERLAAAIPGATVLRIPAGHRACVESTGVFVPALIDACRSVTAGPAPRR